MRVLEGWRVHRRRDPITFDITGPDGALAARVTRARPDWEGVWKLVGILDWLERSERKCWAETGGSVPIHRWVVVELPDGETFRTRNGAPKGPRRRAGNAAAAVRGRHYAFRHTSGSSAEVWRDRQRIAGAWLGGRRRPPDAQRAGFGIGVDLLLDDHLDRTDELMIVLFIDLFGPPGRVGAVHRIFEGVKDELFQR